MLILLGLTLFIFNKKRTKKKGNSMSLCVVLLWLWVLFILDNEITFWVRRSDPRKGLVWPYIKNLLISLKNIFLYSNLYFKKNAWLWFPWSLPPKIWNSWPWLRDSGSWVRPILTHSKMFKIVLHFLVYTFIVA